MSAPLSAVPAAAVAPTPPPAAPAAVAPAPAVAPPAPSAAPPPAGAPANLLSNGGIDHGTNGWQAHQAQIWVDGTTNHGGVGCLRVDNRANRESGAQALLTGILTPGRSYSVSVWVGSKGAQSDTAELLLDYTDSTGRYFQTIASSTVFGDRWNQLSGQVTFTPSGSVTSVALRIRGPQPDVILFVDDAYVAPAGNYSGWGFSPG